MNARIGRREVLALASAGLLVGCTESSEATLPDSWRNADSFESLQDAVDATPDGGVVLLGSRDYRGPVTISKNSVTIRGAGASVSRIVSESGPAVRFTGDRMISGFSLSDVGLATSSSGPVVVVEAGLAHATFERVDARARTAPSSFMAVERRGSVRGIYFSTFEECTFDVRTGAAGAVFDLSGGNVCSSTSWRSCRFDHTEGWAFRVHGGEGSYCYNNRLEMISMEHLQGGVASLSGVVNCALGSIGIFDSDRISKNVIELVRAPGSGPSQGVSIAGYQRSSGRLRAGAYDIAVARSAHTGRVAITGAAVPGGSVKVDRSAE